MTDDKPIEVILDIDAVADHDAALKALTVAIARAEAAEARVAELEDDSDLDYDDIWLATGIHADDGQDIVGIKHGNMLRLRRRMKALYESLAESESVVAHHVDRGIEFHSRIDELQQQLAKSEWLPVTDDWPPLGDDYLGRANPYSAVEQVTRLREDGVEVWLSGDGLFYRAEAIRLAAPIPEWRGGPAPPGDDEDGE